LGENNEEVEATTARNANAAVKSVRVFVLVVCDLVVEFMGDLMSANRITFGCESLDARGFVWLAEGWAKTGLWMRRLLAEEIDEEFGNAGGFFVLEPVRGAGEGVEFGGVAVAEAVVGHAGEKKGVTFAPEDARGDVDGGIGKFGAIAKGGAVPVDHGSERAGLRPCGAVLSEIFGGESAGAAGTD